MKPSRNILLTFDYELFLGERSGDINSCLIQPTKLLQNIYDEFGVSKAIYFVDTTYLACLKKHLDDPAIAKDFEKVQKNISFLLESGHYVFPHIHPHWLDAKRVGEDWILTDLTKYCFKNCSTEERDEIWSSSIDILTEFGVTKHHPIDTFRAGGWSIQPFADFKPYFDKYGIKYDFTVMPETYSWTNAQQYDFTEVQTKLPFGFDSVITDDNGSTYQEFPICTRPKNAVTLSERIFMKYLWKTGNRSIGQGSGVIPNKIEYQPKQAAKPVEMISIELLHKLNLKHYKDHLESNNYMQFISHPKMLTKHNLKIFRKFMQFAQQNFNLDFDFKSLTE